MLPLILLVSFGDALFEQLGSPMPEPLKLAQQHKMQLFMALWLGNMVLTQMANTGAFEVTYNGHVIFSKLETNRMPTLPELVQQLQLLGMKMPRGGNSFGSLPVQ